MSVPFIDLNSQYQEIKDEVDSGLKNIFETGGYILGKDVKNFEETFSSYCDAKYGIGVNSGTDALYLACSALNITVGDEVILPTYTFIATALCISYTGATPVFVDIEEDTYNIDPQKLKEAITEKTKAVIPVHLYGQPANMDEIKSICEVNDIAVIEDAAQAHGATYKNTKVGALGDIACFSFYPTKSLGAFGDGGMIVTSRDDIYEQACSLRDYGRTDRYSHKIKGYNSRLDSVQAVVVNAKLKRLDQWNQMRNQVAQKYISLLQDLPGVIVPRMESDRTHIFQTFAIRIPNRDAVLKAMQDKGIGVLIHYPIPVHMQEAYADCGKGEGDFPVSEKIAKEIMSLPMFPHMQEEQVETVVQTLKEVM